MIMITNLDLHVARNDEKGKSSERPKQIPPRHSSFRYPGRFPRERAYSTHPPTEKFVLPLHGIPIIMICISNLEMDVNSFSFADPSKRRNGFWTTAPFLALVSFILTLGVAFAIAWRLAKGGFVQQPLMKGVKTGNQ